MINPGYYIIINDKVFRVYNQKEFDKILINVDGTEVPYFVKCYFNTNTYERVIEFYNFYEQEIGFITWIFNKNKRRPTYLRRPVFSCSFLIFSSECSYLHDP